MLLLPGQDHRGECLIDLDEVDVVQAELRLLQYQRGMVTHGTVLVQPARGQRHDLVLESSLVDSSDGALMRFERKPVHGLPADIPPIGDLLGTQTLVDEVESLVDGWSVGLPRPDSLWLDPMGTPLIDSTPAPNGDVHRPGHNGLQRAAQAHQAAQ